MQVLRKVGSSQRVRYAMLLLPITLLAILLSGTSFSAHRAAQDRTQSGLWYVHTLNILLTTKQFEIETQSMMRGQRLYTLTGKTEFLNGYRTSGKEAREQVIELRRLTKSSPTQRDNAVRLDHQLRAFDAQLDQLVTMSEQGRKDEVMAEWHAGTSRTQFDQMLALLNHIEGLEKRLLASRRTLALGAIAREEWYQHAQSAIGLMLLLATGVAGWFGSRAYDRARTAQDELQRRATTDSLTGLANRGEFLHRLDRFTQDGIPYALAMLDIDHFKQVNDRYGHPAGDVVIQTVAAITRDLAAEMSPKALVGRLGGEEFGLVMPYASVEAARQLCERLRRRMQSTEIDLPDGSAWLRITLSLGVAETGAYEQPKDIIARADLALYGAKRNGRNQVAVADGDRAGDQSSVVVSLAASASGAAMSSNQASTSPASLMVIGLP
jgi:diguanylate cyclase (GGDEF)-like protein